MDPEQPLEPQEAVHSAQSKEDDNTSDNKPPPKPTKFPVISSANELEIDPSDIMNPVELLKRKIDDMFPEDRINRNSGPNQHYQARPGGSRTDTKGFQFSESYLETKSTKFVRLLSQKNLSGMDGDEYTVYNPNYIADDNVMYTLQNEMMSIFTLIVGIVEGVGLLTLFVAVNSDNTEFLQRFASLMYFIQFLSYILGVILISFCFILLNYRSDSKVISVYHKGVFICCSIGIFICGMIEFPISDRIYFLYDKDNEYFSEEANVESMSSDIDRWRKVHIAQFCLLSVVWILCIGFMHRGVGSNDNKTTQKKNE